MVFAHEASAVLAARLLVGHAEKHEIASKSMLGTGQVPGDHRHRRGQVEHVDGATPPDLAVDDLAAERVLVPAVGVDRYDVGVAVQTEARRLGVSALEASNDGCTARCGMELFHLQAGTLQVGRQDVGVADFLSARLGAVVHAGIADQGLEKFDALVAARFSHRHPQNRVQVSVDSYPSLDCILVS